jgi:1-acyl-sn-glycerol-3-phosphate acyltransferase
MTEFEATKVPLHLRFARWFVQVFFAVLAHLDVAGREYIPLSGPLIVAANHMHVLDLPVVFAVVPRRQTVFAASKWRGKLAGWIMHVFADAIFVERGEPDRQAIAQALEVVKRGGALGVAPEGTRSRTGGLIEGKPGTVYLASRSGAPILPIVVWGQERAMRQWARLRRADIHVRIAPPISLPPGTEGARAAELASYTDALMLTLARMLPPEYRGVYARRLEAEPDASPVASAG